MKLTILHKSTRDCTETTELHYSSVAARLVGINIRGNRPTHVTLTRQELKELLKNPELGVALLIAMTDCDVALRQL